MIDGVEITDLYHYRDPRGDVFHFMRASWSQFSGFGEVYFSSVNHGVVKGWHLHDQMDMNYVCVVGDVRVVLYDDRGGSPTRKEIMEVHLGGFPTFTSYKLLSIPHGVWNGFRSLGDNVWMPAIVGNFATMEYDPEAIHRVHPRDAGIPYDWGPYEIAG
jgi:dTDP-4-dehydrorhamnose 3,5-epimerase